MKHQSLRRTLALLTLLLCLNACASIPSSGTSQDSVSPPSAPMSGSPTESGAAETPSVSVTVPEASTVFAFSDIAQAALDDLSAHRQQEYFAAAFLGEREDGDNTTFSAWLNNTCPQMASLWPFLEEIPEENIFGESGDLYCIVPLAEQACIAVKGVQWETLGNGMQPHYSEAVYDGEVGKPFLLYIKNNDIWSYEPDWIIEYVQEDGFVATWFPEHQANQIIFPNVNGHDCVLDFALLYDAGDYIPYLDDSDSDFLWLPPTALGLGNTTWCSDNGWTLQFGYDETAKDSSGGMVLYEPRPDGDDVLLIRFCHGVWWTKDDCLYINAYNDHGEMVGGSFPVLISPSGEQLIVMQSSDGAVLPFFTEGQTTVGLTLSCG